MITVEAKDGKISATIEGDILQIISDSIGIICSLITHIDKMDHAAGMVIKHNVWKELLTGEISAKATPQIMQYEKTDFSLLKKILEKMEGENNGNS